MLVITLTKFHQRAAQFLDVLEHSDPQQLLLQSANESLDTAVAFRLAYERWRRLHAQVSNFSLIVVTQVLAAVVVPVWGLAGFGSVRDGTSNCAARISRSTRAFDVRTGWKRSRAHTLRWPSP